MNKLHSRLLQSIIISLVILLLIWALGPHLAVDGKVPFHSLLSRLALTILFVLAWILYGLILLIHNKQSLIRDHLIQRTRELLSSVKHRKKPWVLLLGKKKSGKTTLLANAEIQFDVKSSQLVSWWLSENAIFIDPIGNLCFADVNNAKDQAQWQRLLNYLKGRRGKQLFDTVILTIDLMTLSNETDFDKLIEQSLEQISYVSQYNQVTNVTLVVTQCDRIRGFQEFFADLRPEERHQSLGFTLTDSQPLCNLYQERFNAFINRINEHLLWHLHHEQNLSRRARIKDFPLQLEKLGSTIEKIIEKLSLNSKIHINGIYFTSSVQTGNIINLLAKSINRHFQLLEAKTEHHMACQKPYFIQTLLNKIISDENNRIQATTNSWKRIATYSIAIIIVLVGAFFWHHAYRQNIIAFHSIAASLAKSNDSATWLVRINTLQNALMTVDKHSVDYYRWFGLGEAAQLRNQISATYHKLIRTNFVLYLDQLLTKQIQTNINENYSELYNSLQVYLMLVKSDHINHAAIKNWFAHLWANNYQSNKLMQHLNYLLTLKHFSWPTDYALIHQAQTILQKQPLAQTVFMVLQSEYKGKSISLMKNESIPNANVNIPPLTIPAIYSIKNFKAIYNEKIPQLANMIKNTNWIIDNTDTNAADESQSKNLAQKVQAIYLKNYIQEWQMILTSIKLAEPKHLEQLLNEIQMLRDPTSTLWKFLNNDVIKNIVAPNNNVSDADEGNNLGNLIAFLHKNDAYKATQISLQNLNKYLEKIMRSPSMTKAAYETAVKRMQSNGNNDPITLLIQVSKKLPTPINHWVSTLANSSWKIILTHSHQYLSNVWTSSVMPEYNSHIINGFPVFRNSQHDISIDNFNHFFGPGGTMELFFNYYLKPFVNTEQVYWTWKSLNGQHLSIPQKTLNMLIRASMIQKMFYSDNSQIPTIHFDLTPIDLLSNINYFELNIDGQPLGFEHGIKKTTHLSWPGEGGDNGNFVIMRFDTVSADSPTKTFTGPWAWLHLISQSTIESTNNPKQYQITFTLKDNKARYQLLADSPINPYQAQILHAFRMPDEL